jgi:hypothetical protein
MPHAEAEEQIDGADGDCRGVGVAGDRRPPSTLLVWTGIGLLLRAGNQRPDRTHSGRVLARSLPPQRRRRAAYAYATASVALPRLADDCFDPAMHKRGRWSRRNRRTTALYGIGRCLAPRSDRPGSTVRVTAIREEQCRRHGAARHSFATAAVVRARDSFGARAVVGRFPLPHPGGAVARRRCCSRGKGTARPDGPQSSKQSGQSTAEAFCSGRWFPRKL